MTLGGDKSTKHYGKSMVIALISSYKLKTMSYTEGMNLSCSYHKFVPWLYNSYVTHTIRILVHIFSSVPGYRLRVART